MSSHEGHVLLCCGAAEASRLIAEIDSVFSAGRCVWKASGAAGREAFSYDAPRVVVVGPGLGDVASVNLVAALDKDRTAAGERCPILLVDAAPSGSLASRARSAGALRVVAPSGVAAALTKLVAESSSDEDGAVSDVAFDDGGKVVSVASGRGGVGVSTTAALLAIAAKRLGASSLLIDLDAQCGELGYELGGEECVDLVEAIGGLAAHPGKLRAKRVDAGVHMLVSPRDADQMVQVSQGLGGLLAEARRRYVLTVIDVGAVWQDAHIEALNQSDFVVFVMDQRPASVRACHEAADYAYQRGVPAPRMGFVLNRCGESNVITSLDAAVALDGAHVYELPEGSEAVDEQFGAGKPSQLFVDDNPVAIESEELVRQLGEVLGIDAAIVASGRKKRPRARGLLRRKRTSQGGEDE